MRKGGTSVEINEKQANMSQKKERLIHDLSFSFCSRLYTQTQKRYKISETRVREHVQTLGLYQQPGVEVLREPGDDPYDFKEGDIEYTFPTSKRSKSQGRESAKKLKV